MCNRYPHLGSPRITQGRQSVPHLFVLPGEDIHTVKYDLRLVPISSPVESDRGLSYIVG